jgi:hypothetical protein
VPIWVWFVVGLVTVVLFIIWGPILWPQEEPTPTYTPTSTNIPTPTEIPIPTLTPTPSVVMSKTIAIQTHHKNEAGDKHRYVTAMGSDYGWVLGGETTELKEYEKFTILCLNNHKVAFQTCHKNEEGDRHRYVTVMGADDEWRLRGSGAELTECAEFTLYDVDTRGLLPCLEVLELLEQSEVKIALQTCRKNDEGDKNRYVTAMNDEGDRDWELWAQTDEVKDWEKFTLILLP